jgi:hypothetical protein
MSNFFEMVNLEASMLPLNIEHCASLGLPFVKKDFLANKPGVVVCGTGPTLPKSMFRIKELVRRGYAVIAVKQAIRILAEASVKVDYSVAMDPTERQIKKTPIDPNVTYLVATSCHPRMFDYLKKNKVNVEVFHSACGASEPGLGELDIYDKYFPSQDNSFVASGGFTVVNRAVAVAEHLGAKRIYVAGAPFGWREKGTYYESSVKEAAGNASGPTLDDKALVDGKMWYTKVDLLPSAVSLARKAKANPPRFFFLGDSLAASLAARSDEFIERVVPTK